MGNPKLAKLLIGELDLNDEAAEWLVAYKEEDDQLDYKLTIDPSSDKDWLELTKDASAFANTLGGVLVVGVRNKDREIVGLPDALIPLFADANNILQKINRHLDPHLTKVRSKVLSVRDLKVAVVLVPQSSGLTHLISKDGEFVHPSGKKHVALHQGTFYVRRSAANHLGDSRDLDSVVERRIDQFRSALLDKVTRVVNAPADSEVFVLKKDVSDENAKRFIIKDAPDSIPIKGMSFTVAPDGPVEEIAAWTVLSAGDLTVRPPTAKVWGWFAGREKLELTPEQRLAVFRFSLWIGAPAFYWISDIDSDRIQGTIIEATRCRPPGSDATWILTVASFLGKTFYGKVLNAFGDYQQRLGPRQARFPTAGPRSEYGTISPDPKQSLEDCKSEQTKKLQAIAQKAAMTKETSWQERWSAQRIDCFLHARDDKYRAP